MKIRRRLEADQPECVRALREVHDCDGYPDSWPSDPTAWLEPVETAWVAEVDGALVGHVVLVDREDGFWVSRLFVPASARGMRDGDRSVRAHRLDAAGDARRRLDDGRRTIPIERIYSAERR